MPRKPPQPACLLVSVTIRIVAIFHSHHSPRKNGVMGRSDRQNRYPIKFLLPLAQAQGLPASIGGPAPIDGESLAVDETAFLGIGEEGDCPRDVIRSSEARHRHAVNDIGVGVTPAGLI